MVECKKLEQLLKDDPFFSKLIDREIKRIEASIDRKDGLLDYDETAWFKCDINEIEVAVVGKWSDLYTDIDEHKLFKMQIAAEDTLNKEHFDVLIYEIPEFDEDTPRWTITGFSSKKYKGEIDENKIISDVKSMAEYLHNEIKRVLDL